MCLGSCSSSCTDNQFICGSLCSTHRHGSATTDQKIRHNKDKHCSPQQYFGRGWFEFAGDIFLTCNHCCVTLLVIIFVSSWQWSITKKNRPARSNSSAEPKPRIPQWLSKGAGDVITLSNRYSSLGEIPMDVGGASHSSPNKGKHKYNGYYNLMELPRLTSQLWWSRIAY